MLFYGIICINNGSLWLFSSGTGGLGVRLGLGRLGLGLVRVRLGLG